MVVPFFNLHTQEAEVGRPQDLGQPELWSEILLQKPIQKLHPRRQTGLTHLPFRANSMDLMAVVLLVPVVTRKEATRS